MDSIKIERNYPLKKLNTFGMDAKADYFVSVANQEVLYQLMESSISRDNRLLILGGGSNILFINDFNGLVIKIDITGKRIVESNDDHVIIEAGAGENWHEFVTGSLMNGFYGLENLALIPGNVGAAPVQNIGAYGAEQKDRFHSLSGIHLETKKFVDYSLEECRFGYRDSIFKRELKDKFIITHARYKLLSDAIPNLSYKELENELHKNGKDLDASSVYDAVCRLRKNKLPDPAEIGNAGSFFKNPVIEKQTWLEMQGDFPGIPGFDTGNGMVKLSSGWLIEKSGFKGYRAGDAGVFDKHALILVNHGKATGQEIMNLANKITEKVYNDFGIRLEPEVRIV